MKLSVPVILASRSPRRRELLDTIGVPVTVRPQDVDESPLAQEDGVATALRVAKLKATSAVDGTSAVIAADTLVLCDGAALGKPANREDNARMLGRLSGRTHRVVTAVVVAAPGKPARSEAVCTEVVLRKLSADEISAYARTGEGCDKAGGYAIQGIAGAFCTEIRGSYHNVVGLPVAQVVTMLQELGIVTEFP